MSGSPKVQLLTPNARQTRPIPKYALMALAGTIVLSMLIGRPSPPVEGVIKAIAALSACSIAAWLETWIYDRTVGRSRPLRLFMALFMPWLGTALVCTAAMPLGLMTKALGDDETLIFAAGFGAFWIFCSALGTMVIVLMDVLISALVPDFRSRVQLAVLGLIGVVTAFVGIVIRFGQKLSTEISKVTPELAEEVLSSGITIDLGDGPLNIQELRYTFGEGEAADLIAGVYFLSALVCMLPAVLSACGKLADVTMERLHPLTIGFARVAGGDLDVRIEEAGSRDFVELSRGFNRMAQAQRGAFEEVRMLNANLEQQVEVRTKELRDALDDLKGAQAQLIESEKQAMLGRLVAGILHEVNTPLGALRSSANTMQRSTDKLLEFIDKQFGETADKEVKRAKRALLANRKLTDVLGESSERIEKLMGSLSQFISLDTAEFKEHDVREGLESALTLLSKEKTRVLRDFDERTPRIRCYPAKLNRCFYNVLENAYHALNGSGEIKIAVRHDDAKVTIEIQDDGPGIAEEVQAQLFDFGFTTKEGGRMGLKLGLPSSKRWIEELHGQLSVRSALGEGTTVFIQIPIIPKEA